MSNINDQIDDIFEDLMVGHNFNYAANEIKKLVHEHQEPTRNCNTVLYTIVQNDLSGSKSHWQFVTKWYKGTNGVRTYSSYNAANRSLSRAIGYNENPQYFKVIMLMEKM